MSLSHSPKIVTSGLVFAYDMGNDKKSWKGAPTFNASLQNGQNDVSPWSGDGTPTSLGIDSSVKFRGRKVAKYQTGSSGNCYINGAGDLSTGTTSTVWTSTIYLKRVDGTPLTSVTMYQYITNNTNVNAAQTLTLVEDGWYKAVYTRSGLSAGYPSLTGMTGLGAGNQYYFADWQCENNLYSTPWVSETRSNTQALVDLTGNNTVTASSLTYNSDGSTDLDGINDYITFGNNTPISSIGGTSSITVEAWVKYDAYAGNNGAQSYSVVTHKGSPWTWLMENPSNKGRIRFTIGGADVNCADTDTHPLNTWMHWVGLFDGTNMRFYRNGVLKNSVAATGTLASNSLAATVGQYNGSYRMNGQVSVVKIYNKALTAAEVQQNFNALRGRYGI